MALEAQKSLQYIHPRTEAEIVNIDNYFEDKSISNVDEAKVAYVAISRAETVKIYNQSSQKMEEKQRF